MNRLIGAEVKSYTLGRGIIVSISDNEENFDYNVIIKYANGNHTYKLVALSKSKTIIFIDDEIKTFIVQCAEKLENKKNIKQIEGNISKTKKLTKLIPIGCMLGKITELRYGYNYGTNSREIYERCCDKLSFNEAMVVEFGHNRPLYARKAAKNIYSVWFISYNNLNVVEEDKPWRNTIYDDYHIEEEYIDTDYRRDMGDKRLVFVKTKETGYIFIGLYEQVGDAFTKHKHKALSYKRIEKNYK